MCGRVLIVSYYFPPSGGPGALRMTGWVKYLVRAGWEPIVLTSREGEYPYQDPALLGEIPPHVPVYRVRASGPFALYKRLTGRKPEEPLPVGVLAQKPRGVWERLGRWVRANLFVPDARIGWVFPAIRVAYRIIRKHRIRWVLVSSPPHSSQLVGFYLSRLPHLQWIADLRDPWSSYRHYRSIRRCWLAAAFDASLERRILRWADRVTTVSPSLAEAFRKKVRSPEKVAVLWNGFDPDHFYHEDPLPDRFRILHTGNLTAEQNPGCLWEALRWLKETDPLFLHSLEVRLIGRVDPLVREVADRAGIEDLLVLKPFVPHAEAVSEMLRSALLVAVVPRIRGNEGIVTAKLLEYIGSGRPILVIGPKHGDAAQLVRSLSNGFVADPADVEGCLRILRTLMDLWRQGKLPRSDPRERLPFSRKAAVAALVTMMSSAGSPREKGESVRKG